MSTTSPPQQHRGQQGDRVVPSIASFRFRSNAHRSMVSCAFSEKFLATSPLPTSKLSHFIFRFFTSLHFPSSHFSHFLEQTRIMKRMVILRVMCVRSSAVEYQFYAINQCVARICELLKVAEQQLQCSQPIGVMWDYRTGQLTVTMTGAAHSWPPFLLLQAATISNKDVWGERIDDNRSISVHFRFDPHQPPSRRTAASAPLFGPLGQSPPDGTFDVSAQAAAVGSATAEMLTAYELSVDIGSFHDETTRHYVTMLWEALVNALRQVPPHAKCFEKGIFELAHEQYEGSLQLEIPSCKGLIRSGTLTSCAIRPRRPCFEPHCLRYANDLVVRNATRTLACYVSYERIASPLEGRNCGVLACAELDDEERVPLQGQRSSMPIAFRWLHQQVVAAHERLKPPQETTPPPPPSSSSACCETSKRKRSVDADDDDAQLLAEEIRWYALWIVFRLVVEATRRDTLRGTDHPPQGTESREEFATFGAKVTLLVDSLTAVLEDLVADSDATDEPHPPPMCQWRAQHLARAITKGARW